MSPEQRDLLLRYAGWQVERILLDPTEGISHARSSCSGAWTGTWSWETTKVGIEATLRGFGLVVVTWADLRAAAAALTDAQRAAIQAARRRSFDERTRRQGGWCAGWLQDWVPTPPEWLRAAEADERAVLTEVLDSLVVAPELALFEVSA